MAILTLDGWTESSCRSEYPIIEERFIPSFKTICFSILIMALSFAVEKAAHYREETGSPPGQNGSATEEQTTNATNVTDSEQLTPPNNLLTDDVPTPERRAHRFAVASLLLVACIVPFAFRISEIQNGYPAACYKLVDVAPPQWIFITIFNILPFACASTAWLRTLVDCVLVRYDRNLKFVHWPHGLPIFLCFFAVATPIVFMSKAVNAGALALMKKPQSTEEPGEARANIEMDDRPEEERALMGQGGGDDDDDDDATVYSSRGSLEDKKGAPV